MCEDEMKKNYRMIISYDGTRYFGWEHQATTDMTIQGKIENVVTRMVGADEIVDIIGAGRTDAGVHADAMVCNAFLDTEMKTTEIRDYMNQYLPEDICVKAVEEAAPRFHSRYNAVGKTYQYTCYAGDTKPIFDRKYVYVLESMPDIQKMQQAANLLTGRKDFKSFCGNPKMKKSTVREVDKITVTEKNGYVTFTYHGEGFLQHMVRILTGTLLEVGFGKRTPESMTELLEAKKRSEAGFTAPAQGLRLVEVDYC